MYHPFSPFIFLFSFLSIKFIYSQAAALLSLYNLREYSSLTPSFSYKKFMSYSGYANIRFGSQITIILNFFIYVKIFLIQKHRLYLIPKYSNNYTKIINLN